MEQAEFLQQESQHSPRATTWQRPKPLPCGQLVESASHSPSLKSSRGDPHMVPSSESIQGSLPCTHPGPTHLGSPGQQKGFEAMARFVLRPRETLQGLPITNHMVHICICCPCCQVESSVMSVTALCLSVCLSWLDIGVAYSLACHWSLFLW
jgi:hypothetical protein